MADQFRCVLIKRRSGKYLKIWTRDSESQLEMAEGEEPLLVACDEDPEAIQRLFNHYFEKHSINPERNVVEYNSPLATAAL